MPDRFHPGSTAARRAAARSCRGPSRAGRTRARPPRGSRRSCRRGATHEPDSAQGGEMLRRAPGVEAELRLQCPDRALAVRSARGSARGRDDRGRGRGRLRLVDGPCVVRHGQSIAAYLRIFEGMMSSSTTAPRHAGDCEGVDRAPDAQSTEERDMLTLTEAAKEMVRDMVSAGDAPEGSGLGSRPRTTRTAGRRSRSSSRTSLPRATPVLEEDGTRVFLEPAATSLLDDKVLDAERTTPLPLPARRPGGRRGERSRVAGTRGDVKSERVWAAPDAAPERANSTSSL